MQMKFCAMNADHRVMNADKIYTENNLVARSQISEAHVTQNMAAPLSARGCENIRENPVALWSSSCYGRK